MNKLLGLDIGDKYIGIAVSDGLGITAQGYRTYKKGTREDDLKFFRDVIQQFDVQTVVAGLPVDPEGHETSQTRKTQNYCNFLAKRLNFQVQYVDERLTSKAAEDILIQGKVRREDRKKYIDTLAAQMILQTYMDMQKD